MREINIVKDDVASFLSYPVEGGNMPFNIKYIIFNHTFSWSFFSTQTRVPFFNTSHQ